jgi:hypothetical protein
LSGLPLFAEEKICRGEADLVPFIAQLKTLDVPILSVVSDKETGLAPAIKTALGSKIKHQYCQKHYLGRICDFMEADLAGLGAEVRKVEEALRSFERDLERKELIGNKLEKDELERLCGYARAAARRYGRDITRPPALLRHEGLQQVVKAIEDLKKKSHV